MRAFYEQNRDRIDRGAFIALIIAFVYVFFKYLFSYMAPFFFGLLIALAMEPVIRFFIRKGRMHRTLSAVAALLLFIAAVGSLGTVIVTNVSRQLSAFLENAPAVIDEFSQRLDSVNEWVSAWTDSMSDSFYIEIPDIKDALLSALTALFGDGVKDQSLRIVSNMPDFFVGLILMLVSAFILMKDGPLIVETLAQKSPAWLVENGRLMRRGFSRAMSGYFRAQFILMAIVGIICITGLLILRNPYALLIGLVIALLDFLPVVGSGTILLPWIVVDLLLGRFGMAVGLSVMYGILTVVRQSLEPKILGEQIGVHPLITLMSVYIGYKVFGLFGIMIGPSLVMMLKAFM